MTTSRESLEEMAKLNVCACWHYDLANDIDTVDDDTLRAIIAEPYILHYLNQTESPVSTEEFIEEMKQCPDFAMRRPAK